MTRIIAILLILAPVAGAWAQSTAVTKAVTQTQQGIGETGTMYDGNNLVRFPLTPPPSANPASPAAASSGVTGAQGSRDESGNGAGGGEH